MCRIYIGKELRVRPTQPSVPSMPKRARLPAPETVLDQTRKLASQLMETLDEGVQERELCEGRYLALTELTMKLHNKLPGIVWEAQRQAARQRPLSESSFASDVRARDDAEPHAPVAAPAPLAMRIGVPA